MIITCPGSTLNDNKVISIDSAIAAIGIEIGWTVEEIDKLYLDDLNHHGLMWWAKKIHEQNERLKPKKDNGGS